MPTRWIAVTLAGIVCLSATSGSAQVIAGAGAAAAGAAGASAAAKGGGLAKAAGGAGKGGVAGAADKAAKAASDLEKKEMERRQARWGEVTSMLKSVKTLIDDWAPKEITVDQMLKQLKAAKEMLPKLPETKRTESPVSPGGVTKLLQQAETLKTTPPTAEVRDQSTIPPRAASPRRSQLLRGRQGEKAVTLKAAK